MSVLSDSLNDLFDDLFEDAGMAVVLKRGNGPPVPVDAIRGQNATERFGNEEGYATSRREDFIFRSLDYINALGGDPANMDFVSLTDELGNERRFQVGVDGVERPFSLVGQAETLYRVHATEVAV